MEICATGAVSPRSGFGKDDQLQLLSKKNKSIPVRRINLQSEKLAAWRNESRLRRASPISIFMAEAIKQLFEQYPIGSSKCGLICAFSTGALSYSRKFYEEILLQGPKFASPILFPETVFNSPMSHVAAIFKISGPCYSVLGDQASWVNAIHIAESWLGSGQCDFVAVLGAEELDLATVEAYERAGWLGKSGFFPAEGAGALLLKISEEKSGSPKICGLSEGFTYRSKKSAENAARESIVDFKDKYPVARTCQSNWFRNTEEKLLKELASSSYSLDSIGEAFTATAAWNTIESLKAITQKGDKLLLPVWGLNHQCAALLLGR